MREKKLSLCFIQPYRVKYRFVKLHGTPCIIHITDDIIMYTKIMFDEGNVEDEGLKYETGKLKQTCSK